MKKQILTLSVIVIASSLALTACKKGSGGSNITPVKPTQEAKKVETDAQETLIEKEHEEVPVQEDPSKSLQEKPVEAYVEIARRHGLDPSAMAIAFCLTRPFMASVIIGARTMEQLATVIGAKDITLSEEILREIAAVHRQYPMPI